MIPSVHGASDEAGRRLAAVDARRQQAPWRSLDPQRGHARPLVEVGHALLGPEPAVGADALVDGLATIADAMERAFPHNIFGDLDYLAASLWRDAHEAAEGLAPYLRRECGRVAALQTLFGRETAIRFRYVHDFVYGYDWAKWVAREPRTRASYGPFSPQFLAFMEHRGQELLELIADGRDRKYPPLPDGRPRNPFGFSREPEAEIRLHRVLAQEGLLPVETWRLDAQPVWDRPFAELRRQRAVALGLGQ